MASRLFIFTSDFFLNLFSKLRQSPESSTCLGPGVPFSTLGFSVSFFKT